MSLAGETTDEMRKECGTLKASLECPLCLETFSKPVKILPCLHSFCGKCIDRLLEHLPSSSSSSSSSSSFSSLPSAASCPLCRWDFSGPGALKDNVLIHAELDRFNELRGSLTRFLSPTIDMCDVCKGEDQDIASFRCTDCLKNLCDSHNTSHSEFLPNHSVISLDEFDQTPSSSSSILSSSSPSVMCSTHPDEKLNLFCTTCSLALCSFCLVEGSHAGHTTVIISKYTQQMRKDLSSVIDQVSGRRNEIGDSISLVNQMEAKINENTVSQRALIIQTIEDLKNRLDGHKALLLDELDSKAKSKVDRLSQQRKRLNADLDCLDNSVSVSRSLVDNGTDDQMIHLVGQVSSHLLRLKQDDSFTQKPTETKHLEVSINPKNLDLSGVFSAFQIIEVSSLAVRSIFNPSLTPIDYAKINLPRLVFGKDGPPASHLKSPQGVTTMTVGVDSLVVVSDTANHRIQVFDDQGNSLRSFGSMGSKDGQLSSPYGLSADYNDNIAVCDFGNNRVQVFDTFGTHRLSFGSKGTKPGQFNGPYAVAVDHYNNFIVSDNRNNRVQVFDVEGKYVRSFGSTGNADGLLNGPCGVAVDRDNNVVVCDFANNRVQVFDGQGRHLRSFGSRGTGNGQFNGPCGVSVDHHNNIIVSEWNNHRLQVFDDQGNHLRSIGCKGTHQGQFFVPSSLTVDINNHLVVCEHSNHRVQIF